MTDPHPIPPPAFPDSPAEPQPSDPVGDMRESEPPESAPPVSEPPVSEALSHATHFNEPAQPPRRSRTALPVLSALGFLLLLAGLAWLWNEQQGMQQQLAEQARRFGTIAQQPPGVDPARVTALETRLHGLEQRAEAPAATAEGSNADSGKLESRIAALEARGPAAPDPDTGKLESRIAALEARKPAPPPDTAGAMAPLAQKLDSVASEAAAAKTADAATAARLAEKLDSVAADAAAAKSAEAAATARMAELDSRLKQAEQQETTLADRAGQAGRVARAQAALDAGEPLGDVPNAPAALARFAQVRPPTDASLRLSFPAAADAAEDASRPSVEGQSLGERMWLRARSLVTVKRGDAVLVGAPAATVLSDAHARLEAGDLAGAVAALDRLDGAAAQAMADWRGQAQSLLDARAALAKLARA